MFIAKFGRWRFSIYRLGKTCVKQNLDPIVKGYVKRWLRLTQNANFSHFCLPTNHLGLKFSLLSDIYACCQLTTRNILQVITQSCSCDALTNW